MPGLLLSDLVLTEQEGEEHQHPSIVDDPPHIYVALSEALPIGWVAGNILWHQQGHTGNGGLSDYLCKAGEAEQGSFGFTVVI